MENATDDVAGEELGNATDDVAGEEMATSAKKKRLHPEAPRAPCPSRGPGA